MGMAAILFNNAEPFEQIYNIPLREGLMRNLVKIVQAISEKKTVKDYEIYTSWLTDHDHLNKFSVSY